MKHFCITQTIASKKLQILLPSSAPRFCWSRSMGLLGGVVVQLAKGLWEATTMFESDRANQGNYFRFNLSPNLTLLSFYVPFGCILFVVCRRNNYYIIITLVSSCVITNCPECVGQTQKPSQQLIAWKVQEMLRSCGSCWKNGHLFFACFRLIIVVVVH